MRAFFLGLILFPLFCSSQDLVNAALSKYSIIVERNPCQINKLSKATFEIALADYDIVLSDSIVEELVALSGREDKRSWTDAELPKRILVNHNEAAVIGKEIEKIKPETKEEEKKLKKELREYNRFEQKWKLYPVAVSRPVYSQNSDYALLEFILGNSEGQVNLYKKTNGQWVFFLNLRRWVY